MHASADGPPAVTLIGSPVWIGTLAVSAAHSPSTWASPWLVPFGQLMPDRKSRLLAWAASALVALPAAASPAWGIGPVAWGKNRGRATPPTEQMKKANTGCGPAAAQGDRSGILSRNGRATAAPAATRRKERRLGSTRPIPYGLALTACPPNASGRPDSAPARRPSPSRTARG